MPMVWNAEADAKLIASILQVGEVRLSSGQMNEVAQIMGCTPKALTHRIAALKKKGDCGAAAGSKAKKSAPAAPVAAAAAGGGGSRKKKRKAMGDDGRSAQDHDDGVETKRIKSEPTEDNAEDGILVGEDVGEGLRSRLKTTPSIPRDCAEK